MAKHNEQPRHHVLSVRVSDEEREKLEKLSQAANKSMSDMIRELFAVTATR